ncbi:MAG: 16S rRNA (adenine(1518)-N(6)/adenine(1519)-N(6))-dimethyltransferase RsmA [Acidimicrobiia bacterium]|nr:16S rRNA (adenine(1518)-N(6)/adenine(1519)-N(6))-dimethyltransferase RsmA [Acidimicrobiia bacterium]
MTHSGPALRALLERAQAQAKRSLGQNFVVDPNTVRRIAALADIGPGDHVVEIGAGLGSLTLALAETGARVTAVEIDEALVAVLSEVVAGLDVEVVHADARALDWTDLTGGGSCILVANLPYNIATPLVLDLLDQVPEITRMLVMVQREAGERLAAAPGSAAYGLPSVKVRYWATARVTGRVPASVFHPRPRVESVLVEIRRRPDGQVAADADRLFALARAGFGVRRKMLRRALRGLVDEAGFAAAGIDPAARAETLDVDDWARLAAAPAPDPNR